MRLSAAIVLSLALLSCGGSQNTEPTSSEACSSDEQCSPFKCGTDGQCLDSCDFDEDCAQGFFCAKDKFAIEGRCGTKPSDARPTSTDQ